MKSGTLSLKAIIKELDFLRKKVTVEKILDPHNAEEDYRSFMRTKNIKISKTFRHNY